MLWGERLVKSCALRESSNTSGITSYEAYASWKDTCGMLSLARFLSYVAAEGWLLHL